MLDHDLYVLPGHLVRRLNQVSGSLFAQQMEAAEVDLTSVQYAALRTIQGHPMIDQATLAGAIAYDRTTIGGVVDRLEAKNLIRRKLSRSDRRVRLLAIEPAGSALLIYLEKYVHAVQLALLAPLTKDERNVFLRLLQKLAAENNEHSRAPLRRIGPSVAPQSQGVTKRTDVRALSPSGIEDTVPIIEKNWGRRRRTARQDMEGA